MLGVLGILQFFQVSLFFGALELPMWSSGPGEGKTIVALLPTFLAALEDKGGVYVVTPNDYLARRDAENVGQVLRFLGLTVGLVQSTMEA